MRASVVAVQAAISREAQESGYSALTEPLSRAIVRAHLSRWPRVDVVGEYVRDMKAVASAERSIEITKLSSTSLLIDCQGLPAVAAMTAASTLARSAALESRAGVLGLVNTGGMRTLDVWAGVLADSGVVPLMAWNGGPYAAVPYGSVIPFFGTNPFAYGIPTEGEPIIGDMATSEIAFMDLSTARKSDSQLPAGAGIAADGSFTRDPHKVFVEPDSARLLPMGGGPKGSALMLLFEYLTGALVGGTMGRAASSVFTASEFGGIIIMIPDDLFRSHEHVRAEISQLAQEIRDSRPTPGNDSVRLPGDRSVELLSQAVTVGMELSDATASLLGVS